MKLVRGVAGVMLVIVLLGGLGAALGWVGRWAYVVGLPLIINGLAAGSLVAVVALTCTGDITRIWRMVAVLGVMAGWMGHQWMDDRQFQDAFTSDYAAAGFADSGAAADADFSEDDLAFYGEGASRVLEEQVRRKVGYGGFWGRWMFRADAGIRLVGPWEQGRGLAVGRAWALVWALLEVVLAAWLAMTIVSRARTRRSEIPP